MTLQPNEIKLLIALTEAQKASVGLLRGFTKPTREEQDERGARRVRAADGQVVPALA